VTVTPTFGVCPVAALSLQFWGDVHSILACHNRRCHALYIFAEAYRGCYRDGATVPMPLSKRSGSTGTLGKQ